MVTNGEVVVKEKGVDINKEIRISFIQIGIKSEAQV